MFERLQGHRRSPSGCSHRACYLPAWQYWQPVLASFLRWQSTHPAMDVTLVVAVKISILRTSPCHTSHFIPDSSLARGSHNTQHNTPPIQPPTIATLTLVTS